MADVEAELLQQETEQFRKNKAMHENWHALYGDLLQQGIACMATTNKMWEEEQQQWIKGFEQRAGKIVSLLPTCAACGVGECIWEVNDAEGKLAVSVVTMMGRLLVQLPRLQCSGCGTQRLIAPLEMGCFPMTAKPSASSARPVPWCDIRVLEMCSNLRRTMPKHSSMRAFCDMMRRQWALYGAWGCDLEYTLRERELDDRRLGRTWVEYAKFMIKLKAPCTHGLQDKDLFPGPVRCAACRYRIQQLVYDMNFKLTQLESACKQEGPWKDPDLPTRFTPREEVADAIKLHANQAKEPKGACGSRFTAAQGSAGKGPSLRVTGLGGLVCGHGQVCSVQDCLTAGESWGHGGVAFYNALTVAHNAGVVYARTRPSA